jgi:murein DD-endopeptidase MepM/ murein hydrolase activator NlpD
MNPAGEREVCRAIRRAAVACACLLAATSCGGGSDDDDEDGLINYDCSAFPAAALSPYILPWTVGHTYTALPHAAQETGRNQYAVDLLMPIGTPLLAIADGLVVAVREPYLDTDHTVGHENAVLIQHPDTTVAVYGHLTFMGAVVQQGDTVRQGDLIGYSGESGNASLPHTHLAVFQNCMMGPVDLSIADLCLTLPLSFRNASPISSCGLQSRVAYTAQP